MYYRMYRTFAIILVVALVLVACGTPATPQAAAPAQPEQAPEVVTIKWFTWDVGMGSPDEIRTQIIAPFEAAHPNIKVEFELTTWDLYWEKLQTTIAAGNPPDLFTQSVAFANEYAGKGFVENLQPYFDRDLNPNDYFMDVTRGRTLRYPDENGDLYAVPFRWVDAALVYNKTLFDEAGLPYPDDTWTLDKYREVARQLTKDNDNDGEIDQWGTIVYNDWIYPDTIIRSFGGKVVSDDYKTCMLTDPKSIAALQWIVDLIQEDKVAPPMDLASSPGWVQVGPFATGKIAMSIQGAWYYTSFRDSVDFEWDLALVPSGPAGRFVYGGPDSLAIAKSSQHKEDAWEFIKYMLSEDVSLSAIGLGAVPFNKKLSESEAWREPGKPPEHKNVIMDSAPYLFGSDFGPGWLEWAATIKINELAPAFIGEKTVEAAAAAACQSIDEVLADLP